MPDAYTYISKPVGADYTNINTQGREQYDQSSITYDDAGIFYDGVDENAYTYINKPSNTSYGPELVVNGTFTGGASGWSLGTSWSYSSNSVTYVGAGGALSQTAIPDISGRTYTFSVDVNGDAGSINISIGGIDILFGVLPNGTYTSTFTASISNGNLNFIPLTWTGTLDNVSIKEIITNNWTLVPKPTT